MGMGKLVALGLTIVCVSGCEAADALGRSFGEQVIGTIKIAIDLPLPARNGALLAIQQASGSAYGVENFRIQPVILDPPSLDADQARANMDKIIADRRIKVVIGPGNDVAARVMIPLADKIGGFNETLAMVAPYSTDPCLTQTASICLNGEPDSLYPKYIDTQAAGRIRVRNFFRVSPTSLDNGGAASDYAIDNLDARKALVIEDGAPAQHQFADTFQQRFITKGGSVAGQATYDFKAKKFIAFNALGQTQGPPGANALEVLLSAANTAGVDVVVVAAGAADAGVVRAAMAAAKVPSSVPLLGTPESRTDEFLKAAGSAADGSYVVDPKANPLKLDDSVDFITAYKKEFPKDEDFVAEAAYAYDATNAALVELKYLLHFNPGVSPALDDVASSIRFVNYVPSNDSLVNKENHYDQSYGGAIGRIKFNRAGDVSPKIYSYYAVSKGAWTFQDQGEYRG